MNPTAPHFVYRAFGMTGELLYVGCTHDLQMRTRYHRSRTPWWRDEVDTITTTTYPNRAIALAAERVAIVRERPLRNTAYMHFGEQQVEADLRAIEAIHHVDGDKPAGLPGQTALSAARSR